MISARPMSRKERTAYANVPPEAPLRRSRPFVPKMRSESSGRPPTRRSTLTGRRRGVVFPNLKPSTATISLRLPQGMLDELKVLANQRDVPYQSLLKVHLSERIAVERGRSPRRIRRASAQPSVGADGALWGSGRGRSTLAHQSDWCVRPRPRLLEAPQHNAIR